MKSKVVSDESCSSDDIIFLEQTLVAISSSEKEKMLKEKSITEKEMLNGVQKIGVSNS